ncbi:TetR family transcriptional regulator [Shouchella clausii]|uniref:TetR/AcrR family transcriptional regulator n=1 Tax=Shouchella clausii TaxID=79880 RepID=UPI001B282DB8|nr:TetR/AcrR family transcriptional regulator [Shouchella clausii]MCM3313995.1 TetR/AcrR family transcriptional regulator [Psychrobacillus sp. MER TA 17]MDO7269550.1 TetR/AcrR family transcriptional regulator [Shouchella clausii]MDO7289546.1 TetR/AcrR family transcriptional regulator [Shouchella clausii]GIN09655.1 TetR family transcriptional regulator [Shouchella clausii]
MMTESNKSRRRGDKLQNDIYEATYRLLETEGYSAINFTRIAREANTSRSVVYRYWDTPFDLVFAAVRQRMQQAEARFENLDFDRGSLRDHLVYVGQHFILESNNGPFRLFKMLFSEMMNQQERERTGQMLAEATKSNIKIMDDVLQRAIQRGEITKFPPKATKLILFEQIRYTFMLENGLVSPQKLEEIVDHVVLPAILYFSKQ